MKSSCLLCAVLLSLAACAQPNPQADAVMRAVMEQFSKTPYVSYTQTRHFHYFSENYDSKQTASIWLAFASDTAPLRFQASRKGISQVYDGRLLMTMDESDKTIDTTRARFRQLEGNSFVSQSMVMVKNLLPIILASDSISRSVSDTVVDGHACYNIWLEGKQMYFENLGAIGRLTKEGLRRPYELIIDKQLLLPRRFIAHIIRPDDDRDFMTAYYTDINTNPPSPAAESFTYAAYSSQYKPYVAPVKIPLVKTGTQLADFSLPSYLPGRKETVSLKDYKDKVVMVDFWFKSCGPCMEAMPHYSALEKQFGKNGFALLTVNVEDPVEDVAFFYKKYKPAYKMLYDGNALWKGLGFMGCPSGLLLDKTGKVVEVFFGFNKEKLEKKIGELVGE